jgi:hypothetical protein
MSKFQPGARRIQMGNHQPQVQAPPQRPMTPLPATATPKTGDALRDLGTRLDAQERLIRADVSELYECLRLEFNVLRDKMDRLEDVILG